MKIFDMFKNKNEEKLSDVRNSLQQDISKLENTIINIGTTKIRILVICIKKASRNSVMFPL